MKVIGHHHVSDEVVPIADSIAIPDDYRDTRGDLRLLQPIRTKRHTLQFAVGGNKAASISAEVQRKRACQSERDKEVGFCGLKVGKPAAAPHLAVVAKTSA